MSWSGRTALRSVRNWLGAGFGAAAVLPPPALGVRPRPSARVRDLNQGQELPLAGDRGGHRPGRVRVFGGDGAPPGAGGYGSRSDTRRILVGRPGLSCWSPRPSCWWSSGSRGGLRTPRIWHPLRPRWPCRRPSGPRSVGFGKLSCWGPPTLGIVPEVNIVYGVHELDSYDPLTPQKLYNAWTGSTGLSAKPTGGYFTGLPVSLFCPVIDHRGRRPPVRSASTCSSPAGDPGPPGSVFDQKVGRRGPLPHTRVFGGDNHHRSAVADRCPAADAPAKPP